MGEKIVVGPVNKGLKTNREPFVIDNDSFPVLINAYQWRGRIKRKRGTTPLTQLQRKIGTTDAGGSGTFTILPSGLPTGQVFFTVGVDLFTDSGTTADPGVQTLLSNDVGATATLDRVNGILTITTSIPLTPVIYFPALPVMGLEDFTVTSSEFPNTIAFDTDYAYNIPVMSPFTAYDVSFYKNPSTLSYPSYTAKAAQTPTTWNGQDYQQFWTTNYQGALWATNGINIPFNKTNIGMQFAPAATITYVSNTPTTLTVTITNTPLIVGDFVFANEWTSPPNTGGLNFQTGYVTSAAPNTPPLATKTITITFPDATLSATTFVPGILQYLTNRSSTSVDCIRWYDGDPTGVSSTFGWVNFMPPLSEFIYSISDLPAAQYYLVGARMIVPFKDRLLFIGPVVQTSAAGSQVFLQDTVIYSQNGTPYYTSSFTNITPTIDNATLAGITFNPILVPVNQTATAPAYFEDSTGFGGSVSPAIDQMINTVNNNEDVLLLGCEKTQIRLVYSGDDILPFNFFLVNSELGSASTFSSITMDKGALTIGHRGICATSQTGSERIDLEIPDQVFEFSLASNGTERITAQRDYENEWIYFTYPSNSPQTIKFPNQTLQYNYRDDSWAVFNETYTTYGQFRRQSGLTWATLNNHGIFKWIGWNAPWNSSATTLFSPDVIAGNQQGIVLFRDPETTEEAESLNIQFFTGNTVTSPNHGMNNGDYIIINGAQGAIASQVNGIVFSISTVTQNTFNLLQPINSTGSDYQGGAQIQRIYIPFIQTKQFPTGWGIGRKTRIGPQQYLISYTPQGQITLLIYLSQDAEDPFNANGFVNPALSGPLNGSLVYSTVLYTCPESTNLGLLPASLNMADPANTNLLQLNSPGIVGTAANQQAQIWHRVNTSLIGDTIQLGFTLSDAQLRDPNFSNQFAEIEIHGFLMDVNPSMWLA